jgi:predicted SAM-dependent methyltransferase
LLLHAAPEPAIAHALDRCWRGKRVSVDAFDPDVDVRADLTALPFAAAYADVILCSHVLEHIEDDAAAVSELYRVLRPGGRAYIMVPIARTAALTYEDPTITAPAERAIAFGHPYHVRVCGMDYGDRIRAAGFTVAVQDAALLSRHQRRRARLNKAIVFVATKPGTVTTINA